MLTNKEEAVKLLRDSKDGVKILTTYCLYMGKKEEDIAKFLQAAFLTGTLNMFIAYAMRFILEKFEIITLTNKDGKIINYF